MPPPRGSSRPFTTRDLSRHPPECDAIEKSMAFPAVLCYRQARDLVGQYGGTRGFASDRDTWGES